MLRDSFQSSGPALGLTPQIPKKTIIRSITTFIEKLLVHFRNTAVLNEQDEESITEELVKYLTHHAKNEVFFFVKESIQRPLMGRVRRTDIGAFVLPTDRTPVFTIEAKRLPAPGKVREKEYVIGSDSQKPAGGIERYKRNLHGIETDSSAIVGYIQKEDIDYWVAKINSWLDELIIIGRHHEADWNTSDKLLERIDIITDVIAKYRSTSSRGYGGDIELTHYLIVMPQPA
ncbi:hypothetical protein FNT36_24890 [Hymenobacter setariae]|uniref:Uncharacterized protein n=1 Tax=Hymenobacter setariae TaxID=2594794 RepID=A0A558BJS5_9BACT|nr:hypothetical protein [Hymenobacter setariae]TVT36753.1 hypothetical protein FNT36_24890 [Hymenobacter setariae]